MIGMIKKKISFYLYFKKRKPCQKFFIKVNIKNTKLQ